MSRRKAEFAMVEINRAIRAARAAGLDTVELIHKDGRKIRLSSSPGEDASRNPWDEVLNGNDQTAKRHVV